jgi:hypothetical protein
MIKRDCYEVLMWSDGYEGRLWEWRSEKWRVLEYYNYRHTFKECDITERDITALRNHFDLSADDIPDSELFQLSPDKLMASKVRRL